MENHEYTLGLDIGTNSVGWAVVDENNNLVKRIGHSLWGVRMFEAAEDSKNRRSYRNARRRYQRRKERILLLQDIFKNELDKVDPHFFTRLNDSFFHLEDRKLKCNDLFVNYLSNAEYYKKFPTIWHLRNYLINSNKKEDIRLIYLAIHHIIKYRGNFLKEGDMDISDNDIIINTFNEFNDILDSLCIIFNDNGEDEYDEYLRKIEIDDRFINEFTNIMTKSLLDGDIKNRTITDKKNNLKELFKKRLSKVEFSGKTNIYLDLFIDLMVSGKKDFAKLFITKNENYESSIVDLNSENYETEINSASTNISNISSIINFSFKIKELRDHFYLINFLGNEKTISGAFLNKYNEHHIDLIKLKELVKKYLPNRYDEVFRDSGITKDKPLNSYSSYIGMCKTHSYDGKVKTSNRDLFYSYIKKILEDIKKTNILEEDRKHIDEVLIKIENKNYLLKSNSTSNSAIPHQLHLKELKEILNRQGKFYDFLNYGDKISNKDKILSIFSFKRPYFIGPLKMYNDSKFNWAILKKNNERIYPWNFEDCVDYDSSAEIFIKRMQNKCTYLKGENDYCLPKASIYFQAYNCLEYLNKIKINGSLIDNNLKKELFINVFLNPANKTVTESKIKDYLSKNYSVLDDTTGIPKCNAKMSTYIDFANIFGKEFTNNNLDFIENIVKDITIFEDKKVLEKRLKEIYKLDNEKIKKIKGLNYKTNGRLCLRLLNKIKITNKYTGEIRYGILPILWETNLNLQEILFSETYELNKIIEEYNLKNLKKDEDLPKERELEAFIDENITISPIWRRAFNQAYKLIEEIEDILKTKITYFVVECTRTNKEKKVEKHSRKDTLIEQFKKAQDVLKNSIVDIDYKHLNKELDESNNELFSDKYLLYFQQLGKDIYTLKDIDINDLGNYEIDHIYPQSLIKDDSISNRVLTYKYNNSTKSDTLLPDLRIEKPNFLAKNADKFYKFLFENHFISRTKYERLIEKEISDQKMDGFINRQKVATDQSVKALIQTLILFKGIKKENIIYSKAENISDFRHNNNIYKSRTANNYHHTHDAYLNAVCGKALENYYRDRGHFYKKDYEKNKQNKSYTVSPKKILDDKVKESIHSDKIIWNGIEEINKIKNNIFNNYDIQETTRTNKLTNMMSKVSVLSKGHGFLSTKQNTPNGNKMDVNKYGGFNSAQYTCYIIVEVKDKKEGVIHKLIPLQSIINENNIDDYLKRKLKTNEYKIINRDIRTHIIFENNNKKYFIEGVSSDSFLIKNAIDRNFDIRSIKIIHDLDKLIALINIETKLKKDSNKYSFSNSEYKKDGNLINLNYHFTLHENKKDLDKNIILDLDDLQYLYSKIRKMYNKNIYSYSNIINIYNHLPEKLVEVIFEYKDEKDKYIKYATLINELLKLLKTNERTSANLELIDLSKNSGILTTGSNIPKGTKIVSYSMTGLRKKIIFEN